MKIINRLAAIKRDRLQLIWFGFALFTSVLLTLFVITAGGMTVADDLPMLIGGVILTECGYAILYLWASDQP